LAGLGVHAAETAQTGVDVPDHAVASDVEPAHCSFFRQIEFPNRHRLGIDLEQTIATIAGNP